MEVILIYDYENTVQVRADHEQCETEEELVEYSTEAYLQYVDMEMLPEYCKQFKLEVAKASEQASK